MSSRSARSPGAAALADLLVDQLVGRARARAGTGASRAVRWGPSAASSGHPARVGGPADDLAERGAEPSLALLVLHAEDRAHDHLEGERLHARQRAERLAERPALDLAPRPPAPSCPRSRAAARRGRAAASACAGACGRPRRAAAPSCCPAPAAGHVRLAGVQQPRVAGEDLLDRVRVGDEHPGALVGDLERERVAVAAPAVLHVGRGAHEPAAVCSARGALGPGGRLTEFTYQTVSEYPRVCNWVFPGLRQPPARPAPRAPPPRPRTRAKSRA